MKAGLPLTIATCALWSTATFAQFSELQNPSFATADPCDDGADGPDANGWGRINFAVWRTDIGRTDTFSMELAAGSTFVGVTSDRKVFQSLDDCFADPTTIPFNRALYFFQPPLDGVINPPDPNCPNAPLEVAQESGEPITVSGWYMIPKDQPLNAASGIKLEFRRTTNNSNYQEFENLSINGLSTPIHTNGEWVKYTWVFNQSQFRDPLYCFPPVNLDPENPVAQVRVLPIRFNGDNNGGTGTIFWDDISLTQGTPCAVDFDGSGTADVPDIFAFLALWFAGDPAAEFDGTPGIGVPDIFAFLALWFAGCP